MDGQTALLLGVLAVNAGQLATMAAVYFRLGGLRAKTDAHHQRLDRLERLAARKSCSAIS